MSLVPSSLFISKVHCAGETKAVPKKQKQESPVAKMLISAGCTWVFELGIGHYLEVLKIAKQTSELSYAGITRQMLGSKGIVGVLDGFFPWGTLQALCKGGAFGFGHS